jgi:hypothetical protein
LRVLDGAKEQLAYLRFWQSVAVVTDISAAGWLISASAVATGSTVALAWLGVLVLSFGIFIMHRRIERYIGLIESL